MSEGTNQSNAASKLSQAVSAAHTLSDALWGSLQQELAQSSYERAHALAQQLGEIASAVALLVDEGRCAPMPAGPAEQVIAQRTTASPAPAQAAHTPAEPIYKGSAVSVETHQSLERRTPPEPTPPPVSSDFGPGFEGHSRAQLIDEQQLATVMPFAPASGEGSRPSDIAILDGNHDEDSAAWISLVGRSLARHAEDHLPFAVLLIEIVEVAHLERSATPHDLHTVTAQVESALACAMRSADELSRETLGRYWLLTPDTGDAGAHMLAERLVRLVGESSSNGAQPLQVAIGVAVCPQDATEAPTLTATAELGVYTARLTGRSVVHAKPPQH
ncbi:MAG: hypothetical protein ACRDK2_15380 [Solirubrobacteraceae bacterium]